VCRNYLYDIIVKIRSRVAVCICTAFFCVSCGPPRVELLEREHLFTLEIGRLEDQVDLFQAPGQPMNRKTRVAMRDGLLYISNGSANKIMQFTSYGDVLTLIYNPDENPRPVQLQQITGDSTFVNRKATGYHFRQVGEITVGTGNMILAEDRLPAERTEFDEDLGVGLNRLILRFGPDGELIDYLGQEGIGGSPFPYVESLHINTAGEMIVVSRTLDTWLVFWYTPEGNLLYRVQIPLDRLPLPDDTGEFIPSLEKVLPDRETRKLYLNLNYYRRSVDPDSGAGSGIETFASRIYWLDLSSGRYEGYVDIPENVQTGPGRNPFDRQEVQYLYEFIGTGWDEHFFLLGRDGRETMQLLVMNSDGKVRGRRLINVDDLGRYYKTFHVSRDGVLTALLAGHDKAHVVWWRSDRLIGGRQ
jgi:hypothetical protein